MKTGGHTRAILLLVVPPLAFYTVFVMVPTLGAIAISLTRWKGIAWSQMEFVGLQNYAAIFTDGRFWQALLNNFWFVLGTLLVQVPLALSIAIILDLKPRFSGFFSGVFLLPRAMAFVVIALLFRFFFAPAFLNGLINVLLSSVGLEALNRNWLNEATTAMPSLVSVHIWRDFGFMMFLFLAGLSTIPTQLYDAAKIDGASMGQVIWHVSLPMLREIGIVATTMSIIAALRVFEYVFVMTGGGPYFQTEVVMTYLYKKAFSSLQLGYANAGTTIFIVILLIMTVAYLRLTKASALRKMSN